MKNKPVVFSKQIHSCFASCASGDVTLKFQVDNEDLDFELIEGNAINTDKHDKFKCLEGEVISEIYENEFLVNVYLGANKTFYERGLKERGFTNYSETEEFINLVKKYTDNGWQRDNYLQTKIYNQQSYLEEQLRRFNGFVIPTWDSNLGVEDYRGALSKEIFEDVDLQKYLSGGGCHGYIGSSSRTYETDRALIKIAKQSGATNKQISNFLSHSRGRHFADQLGGKEEVEKYFDEYFWPTVK